MLSEAILFLFLCKIAPSACATHEDAYFPGRVEETIFNVEWMACLQACHDQASCISYNYFKENKTCEINSNGIKKQCDSRSVLFSRGWIFHQIRPVPEEKRVPELGDDPSTAAESCEDIFSKRRNVSSGTYHIQINKKTHLIYCKMENTVECGEGGWALAMKIDGNKSTFKYSSELWKNVDSYNEEKGRDLTNTETKVGSLFSQATYSTGLCVGMKVNDRTKWLKLPKRNDNLMGIFHVSSVVRLNIDRATWKSLINGSSVHDTLCTPREGFNVDTGSANGAKARIGFISYKDNQCNGEPVSRIGFGTEGSSGGMDPTNTCGNEATDGADNGVISIKAFCYILVK